tara:strand:- start:4033 stop:4215 length:183 start_codon:yes stop_codon:yes gene_type:complete
MTQSISTKNNIRMLFLFKAGNSCPATWQKKPSEAGLNSFVCTALAINQLPRRYYSPSTIF